MGPATLLHFNVSGGEGLDEQLKCWIENKVSTGLAGNQTTIYRILRGFGRPCTPLTLFLLFSYRAPVSR